MPKSSFRKGSKTKGTRVTLINNITRRGTGKGKTKSQGDGRHVARKATNSS